MKCLLYYFFFASVIFCSCEPISGIYITNKLDYDIYIEHELNNFSNSAYNENRFENNIDIKSFEQKYIIAFLGTSVLEQLGYKQINTLDDIIGVIDQIFKDINVYKINDNEKIKIYDKEYFLNKTNLKKHNYIGGYRLEYIIK